MATIESLEAKLWLNKERQEFLEKQKTFDETKKSLNSLKKEIIKQDDPEEILNKYDTKKGREEIIKNIESWVITAEIFEERYLGVTGKPISKPELNTIFTGITGTNVQKKKVATEQLTNKLKNIKPAF